MKSIGLVVEYNPFHNGHKYHLENAKKNPDDIVIAVMSGDFVQRGEPSIIDRWTKTKIALKNGVDLVVELPVFYSCQSAEIFAKGAIGVLNELKCTEILFGSETNNIENLFKIANFQESSTFKEKIKNYLNMGFSYPTAHSHTMKEILGQTRLGSNDILGLEYIKAINYWNSSISPKLLKREKTGYYDLDIIDNFASATKIRENIKLKKEIKNLVPLATLEMIENYQNYTFIEKFYPLIRYEIIKNYTSLNDIQDMEIGFENRLYEYALKYENYQKFFESITNKRYTMGRTQRILTHILLALKKDITSTIKQEIPYVKILGFNDRGQQYLGWLKQFGNPKIITSYKNMNNIFNEQVVSLIEYNEKCSNIYRLINPYKEYKSPIIQRRK